MSVVKVHTIGNKVAVVVSHREALGACRTERLVRVVGNSTVLALVAGLLVRIGARIAVRCQLLNQLILSPIKEHQSPEVNEE